MKIHNTKKLGLDSTKDKKKTTSLHINSQRIIKSSQPIIWLQYKTI